MILEVNNDTFNEEVLEASNPVVVDFYASWCTPCKMLTPVLEETKEELLDQGFDFDFVKVNIDDCPEIAEKYDIKVLPTLVLFKDGKEIEKKIRPSDKDDIIEWLG